MHKGRNAFKPFLTRLFNGGTMQTATTLNPEAVRGPGVRRGVLPWLIVALVCTAFQGTALAGWTENESGGKWFRVGRIWMDHSPAIMAISLNGTVGNCAQRFILDKNFAGVDRIDDDQYKAMYSMLLASMTVGVELNIAYNYINNQCYINQLEVRPAGGDLQMMP
jgi:hypothetical protein